MKKPYLVSYDYGMGGLLAYLLAESEGDILRRFPELLVPGEPPPWMSKERQAEIVAKRRTTSMIQRAASSR